MTDAVIRQRIEAALGLWNCTGYITWKQVAAAWVRANLDGYTTKEIGRLMHQHARAGGAIDQVPERRPEWSENRFHYDFRFTVDGRRLYIETVLHDDDPDDPTLYVVSIHDA